MRSSAAPHTDGKGQGSSQGALKGTQCEFIDLDHRSMNCANSLKPLRGVPGMWVEVRDESRRVGGSTRVLMEVGY